MGCDGGSIPKRNELVKTKKKFIPRREQREDYNWAFCALSKTLLSRPIVSDGFGRLYNKDAIIEYLLKRSKHSNGSAACKDISSLSDVCTLNVTRNPALKESVKILESSDLHKLEQNPPLICPITNRSLNGKSRFLFIWKCGCLFSSQALKVLPRGKCPVCEKEYDEADLIPVVNITEEDRENMRKRILRIKEERKGEEKIKEASSGNSHTKRKRKESISSRKHINPKNPVLNDINMPIPDLIPTYNAVKSMIDSSDAVKTLYERDKLSTPKNYLVYGTFNRFAATF